MNSIPLIVLRRDNRIEDDRSDIAGVQSFDHRGNIRRTLRFVAGEAKVVAARLEDDNAGSVGHRRVEAS